MRYRKYIILILCLGLVVLSVFIVNYKNKNSDIINEIQPPKEHGIIEVNNQDYDSLTKAIGNCDNFDTIVINSDLTENIKIKNKNFIIDGNFNTIYSNINNYEMAIMEFENCNITIKNLIIDGQNKVDENGPSIGLFLKDSTLTLENVEIININHAENKLTNYPKCYAIYCVIDEDVNQDIYINKCKFINDNETTIYINNRSNEILSLSISDNYIENKTSLNNENVILIKGLYSGEIVDNEFKIY